ncbi:MAG: hypothetical protein CMJ44_14465 [Pimelobacter sp.]|nr:hypothetical protein [Pimelobacter sp.]
MVLARVMSQAVATDIGRGLRVVLAVVRALVLAVVLGRAKMVRPAGSFPTTCRAVWVVSRC